MTDIADEASDLSDETVEQATAETLSDFLIKCNGKVMPYFVRPELIMVLSSAGGAQLANMLAQGVLNAVTYADLWLKNYYGHDHTVQCGVCCHNVECHAENGHSEIGGFMTLQDEAFDINLGGMVIAVCTACAAQPEEKVYEQFSGNIGGKYVSGKEAVGEDLPKVPEPLPPGLDGTSVLGETGTHVLSDETQDIVRGLVGND